MLKKIKYALLTCLIAYVLATFAAFIFSLSQSGWSRVGGDNVRFMVDMMTVGLSNYDWWGNVWPLAALVPWLFSSLVLALVLRRYARTAGRRALWGGLSVAIYYAAMLLAFAIGKLATSWGNVNVSFGDLAYILLLIWPVGGYIAGYFAAMLTDKIVRMPDAD